MNTYRYTLPLCLLIVISGFPKVLEAQEDLQVNSGGKIRIPDTTLLNTLWKNARNAKDTSLLELYTQDAVKVVSADSTISGPSEILKYYAPQEMISSVLTLSSTEANTKRGIRYEINAIKAKNTPVVIQLVIYEKLGERELRAFEYDEARPLLNPESVPGEVSDQLNKRREQWMAYCNAHDVPGLVYDLYSHNTLYYNHRPLVKGRQALVREYAYMNNEEYRLNLKPTQVAFVNDTTVFEIGQCEGSYNGKYILIWKKEEDGVWRIFIDSNV